jgi:hypothetical protein
VQESLLEAFLLATHEFFEWRWHNFAVLGRKENYVPVLEVLADYDCEKIGDVRDELGKYLEALGLKASLGSRDGAPPDIFRDRADIWRFTGTIYEPGLVGETVKLTPLGEAIVARTLSFEDAMARQAARLRFPRIRVRYESELEGALGDLKTALAFGKGARVIDVLGLAAGCLRELGQNSAITGAEAARFLSGTTRLDEVPIRADAIAKERAGEASGFQEISPDWQRQGNEMLGWMKRSGVLLNPADDLVCLDDPASRFFEFAAATADELRRWAYWWGMWP